MMGNVLAITKIYGYPREKLGIFVASFQPEGLVTGPVHLVTQRNQSLTEATD
jgi:hypothetical protein